jgi:hypothetical protein
VKTPRHTGSCECDAAAFANLRRHWHIDGLPSDFIPGTTDHYGTIHNFDMLCGVLLSDVHERMSGELCVYPGSHAQLAKHFSEVGLQGIQTRGNAALPTGAHTDALFAGASGGAPPAVHHCIGKAGDVFLANYMTAHFVAPNCSADIRYAVYFRVHGPAFGGGAAHQSASMLNPWVHWFGLNDISPDDARAVLEASRGAAMGGRSVKQEEYYAAASNDHTVPSMQ